MKTKILFVLPEFKFGGTVFSTYNVITLLDPQKYDISVLAMTHQGGVKEKYEKSEIKILPENIMLSALTGRWNEEKRITRKSFFIFSKIIKRLFSLFGINYLEYKYGLCAKTYKNYDVVVACQEGVATMFSSYISAQKRIAWFRSECKYWIKEVNPDITKAVNIASAYYNKFNSIVCVSETTRKDMGSCLPLISDKLVAIHNLQDYKKILQDSADKIEDERFSTDKFTIISIGRMSPQKRFSEIPAIADKLRNSGCSFKWYILGGGNTYNEYDKLVQNIKNKHIEDFVICLGEKLNPYPYIAHSDLVVNTSYIEACPRVVIESKIIKTPVVCADFSSSYEFITDNVDGFISDIDNIDKPISLMIQDKDTYNRIKQCCENYRFSNEALMSKIEELFV